MAEISLLRANVRVAAGRRPVAMAIGTVMERHHPTPPHPTPSMMHKASSLSEVGFDAGGASSCFFRPVADGCPVTPTSSVIPHRRLTKISVIGAGNVGMAIALTILTQNLADEITLVDALPDKLHGEALDLQHATASLPRVRIVSGIDAAVTKNSDLIIVTAGARQIPGETRLNLLRRNVALYSKIVPPVAHHSPDALLLVVFGYCILTLTSRLALGWRIRLTNHLLQYYLRRNAFYKVLNMSGKSINADQRLTLDVDKLTTDLAGLVTGMVKPLVDILWFTWRMKLLSGRRGVGILYDYMLLGLGFLRAISPDFGHLASEEQELEGTFRYSICCNKSGLHEVILGTTGMKQGTSSKAASLPSTESLLCKLTLVEAFISLEHPLVTKFRHEKIAYRAIKDMACEYQQMLELL
ncbi:L-lactate dehydrogenase A [Hordeum vulgare]|nr:L-lactate dehydrogenase A [Hordeum vulgare]